jgi:hypothetical protein
MATIISHRKKFIFIHITKTAGTSVTSVLEPYADPPILSGKFIRNSLHILSKYTGVNFYRYTGNYILPLHVNGNELKKRFPDLDFHQFYCFSFVRNPWDRLVSTYTFLRLPRKNITSPKVYKKMSKLSFPKYVEYTCLESKPSTQYEQMLFDEDGKLRMDYIGKMENFSHDFKCILESLNIKQTIVPHTNTTKHAKYVDYYDDYTRKLVSNAFALDIEAFQYRFGD